MTLLKPFSRINAVRLYSNYQPQKIRIASLLLDNGEPNRRRNDLLGENKEYPFPGAVTCEVLNSDAIEAKWVEKPKRAVYYTLNWNQVANLLAFPVIKNDSYEPEAALRELCRWNVKIELRAIACPLLLKKDLLKLFPNADVKFSKLTLINLYEIRDNSDDQNNVNTGEKADSFVLAASSICTTLRMNGYWADFVDPSSNSSRFDNNSYKRIMNQSDEYKFSGIKVVQNEGCKVVNQVSFQESPFIGTVFTNASQFSNTIKQILNSND